MKANKLVESILTKLNESDNLESKRVPEYQIRENGYQYFSTHGTGPGTCPDDVNVRELNANLPGGWVTFKTDRPLTSEELEKYDIKSEEMNPELKDKFNLEENFDNAEEQDAVLNKTIKVYDINALIDEELNDGSNDTEYRSFDFNNGAAIIVTPSGDGCILDYEAIGTSFNATSDTINLNLCPKDGDDGNGHKTFALAATARIKCTIDELLRAPSKEMKVKDFFYKWNYNDRCEQNFDEIKHYLVDGE